MPTRAERDTVIKLMLLVETAFDENRKEIMTEPRSVQFTLDELRPTANEAMAEGQKMLASWGGK